MKISKRRVGIYMRVSTESQTIDSQAKDLREYATHRFESVEEFIDIGISGAKDSRPALDSLMDAVRKRKIDVVLVWSFSRFSRSLKHLVTALEEFKSLNVDFVSYSENLDSSTPSGLVLFAVIGAFAQFQRETTVANVRAGLRAARARGKILGRPKKRDDGAIRELRSQGLSIRQIATRLRISTTAVQRGLGVNKTP